MFSDATRALVVAAHPDDEVLGVGGTVPLLREAGCGVDVLIVTDGSSIQYEGQADQLDSKKQEARAAAEVMGANEVFFMDYPDMQLDTVPHYDLNRALHTHISSGGYDTVFTHAAGDVNLDHAAIYRSTLVACRPVPGHAVRRVLAYFVASSSEWGARRREDMFWPNLYVDIGRTVSTKAEALGAYRSELRPYPHPRSAQAVRERAAVTGSEAGYAYAEAFSVLLWRVGA